MKRSHPLYLMVFAIMMIPMLAIGAFWKASEPVVTVSNVQASTTEITLDYTLTDTDPASIMTTSGYSPEAVLVDSSGLVLASETLQIDTPSSLSLSGFSLTYGEEYTIQFDVPYDLLGVGAPYNEEPYTIYEEAIIIDKQAPTAIIYGVNDTPASIVTGSEIEVHYDLVDDDETLIMNETIAPRMVIWNNTTDEVVDIASVEIGQDQVVIFSGLEDSIIYRVEITGQYDVDGDGLTDNVAPYVLAEQQFTVSYSPQWDQVYGGSLFDNFDSVIQTSDGGYLAVGHTYSNGDGELTDTNNSYPECLDVEFSGTDTCSDALIVKFDSEGNPLWHQVYGGSRGDMFYSVVQSSDGGYLAVGYTRSYDGELTDTNTSYPECLDTEYITYACQNALMVKFDSEGNHQWDKLYEGMIHNSDKFYSVIATTDGGYLIVGELGLYASVVKVDSVGTIQWEQTYVAGTFYSVIATRDGGYVAAGRTPDDNLTDEDNGVDGLLIKFDENGNPLWEQAYGSIGYEAFLSVTETSTGEYIVAGNANSYNREIGSNDSLMETGLVAKFDTVGNPIWQKVYDEAEWTWFESVTATSDGGYLVAGWTDHDADDENEQITDSSNGDNDGLLIKFDSEGNQIWDELYGESDSDTFYSVIETSEGDYVAAGRTDSDADGEITDSNNGSMDALLVKFPAR